MPTIELNSCDGCLCMVDLDKYDKFEEDIDSVDYDYLKPGQIQHVDGWGQSKTVWRCKNCKHLNIDY